MDALPQGFFEGSRTLNTGATNLYDTVSLQKPRAIYGNYTRNRVGKANIFMKMDDKICKAEAGLYWKNQ